MRIAVTRQESFSDFLSPTEQPWKAFFDWFSTDGHDLVSLNDDPDVIIFMNHHREFGLRALKASRRALKVLVLWNENDVYSRHMFGEAISRARTELLANPDSSLQRS